MYVRWPRVLTPTHLSRLIRNQKNPLKALRIFNEAKSRYPNYHHNGPVYAAMINILGSCGQIFEMKKVIDQMKDDSCECQDSVFASAIKTYANVGMLDEAISLFRNIPKFNCVNWTESFNTLLQIMIKEHKLETAHHLFLENSCGWGIKSQIHSLNLIIGALCQSSRSDLALQVFQEMNHQFCYPNKETYRILMRGLCADGRLNEATHLLYSMFWRISQKGSGEDIVIYRTLLDTLCDNGQIQEAVDILGKILRKGLKAPKRCRKQLDLSQILGSAYIKDVKFLMNEALVKGGVPSLGSYSAMAVDLYSEDNIDEANRVLKEMQDRGFKPPHLIYEAKIAALCRIGRVEEAMDVIDSEMIMGNRVPTVGICNTIIKGMCLEGNSAVAVDYSKKMFRQVGCVPDKETYTILVNGLCNDGRYIEASNILKDMLINSYWPCADTFNALIHGLCLTGRPYEAIIWLEEMVSQAKMPEPAVWNLLVTSFCTNKLNSEVSSIMLEQLRKKY